MSSQLVNKIKINFYLVSNQFFIVLIISCAAFHDLTSTTRSCFNPSHSYAYIITIVRYIFNMEIFKSELFSSEATCLHTRLTKFFLNRHCLLCLLTQGKSLMNALELSINVNKSLTLLLFGYFVQGCHYRVVVAY